jgi:predicted helicase
LLKTKLGIPDGVAGSEVTVLDPATGTGTYLLQVLQQGIDNVSKRIGPGAVSGVATQMARNLYGFELLVGPYAVAHLRLNQAIKNEGGHEPDDGVHIYLTDTLESPNESGKIPHSYFEAPLAEEHRRAREVKRNTRVLVCIGNPPYEREITGPDREERQALGGWIRFGDKGAEGSGPLFEDFLRPAREAGFGGVLQPTYNLYVYFWRWALWKIFETQDGPGIVSYISASSYLRGPGFAGMREELRRSFDELWILDLQGDGRGSRVTENVFDILTPVAIAIGIRTTTDNRNEAATVRYTRVTGTRADKVQILDSLNDFEDLDWQVCPSDWLSAFSPVSDGDYFSWPQLGDLLPWSHVGSNIHRRWPVGETEALLIRRWDALVASHDRADALQETQDRKANRAYPDQIGGTGTLKPLNQLDVSDSRPRIERYGFRSFDRQWVIADSRLADRFRPPLWLSRSAHQIYLTAPLSLAAGAGPIVTVSPYVPDLHHYNGRGGKDILPLYRDAAAQQPNIATGLLPLISTTLEDQITSEDLVAYIVALLAHPGYTERFHDELEVPGPRVPLTKDPTLFQRAVDLGRQVIAWQTYAERFSETIGASQQGRVPSGTARLTTGIPNDPDRFPQSLSDDVSYSESKQELRVGEGRIANVNPRIWAYEVSGLRVVRSWLGYRMKDRAGRKSSDLDNIRPERWTHQMTTELMELLWVLEGVIALEPAQDELLAEILAGLLFLAEELPEPTEAERQPPRLAPQQQVSLGGEFL